jgi:hypothetical protein
MIARRLSRSVRRFVMTAALTLQGGLVVVVFLAGSR